MTIEAAIKQKKFSSPYHKLIINLTYTANWIMNKQMEVLRPFDLSPQQYNVLRILKGSHPTPMRIQDITERMLDKTSNTSRLVDKLAAKNRVIKQPRKDDRRACNIMITAEGLDLLEKATPMIAAIEKFMHQIEPEDIEKISDFLDAMRHSDGVD